MDETQLKLEQLKLFQDYTKWHVGLYAGGTLVSLGLTQFLDRWPMRVALLSFLLAAACAGTLLGNLSRFKSEDELDSGPMKILRVEWFKGKAFRVFEKLFFWAGVVAFLVALAPRDEGKVFNLCVGPATKSSLSPKTTCYQVVMSSGSAP